MNRNDKLKKAYRDLQLQDTPDLWEQISGALPAGEDRAEGDFDRIHADGTRRTHRRFHLEAGIAAAACLIFLTAGGLTAYRLGRQGDYSRMGAPAAETQAAAGDEGTKALDTGEFEAAEATGNWPEAGAAKDGDSAAAKGMWDAAEETKEMWEASAEAAGKQGLDAARIINPQEPTAAAACGIIQYDSLALCGAAVKTPVQKVAYAPKDQYFTEETLKETSLLSQAVVRKVSYTVEADGQIHSAVYEIEVDKILYAEDYISPGQKIRVKSPLVEGGASDSALYGLKEGGTYVLPLKYEDGEYWLVFPCAPQIEVTQDSGYVFHNGWRSLINDETSVVLMTSRAPGDTYYDRMVMREDPAFLSELTQLVEKERQPERRT